MYHKMPLSVIINKLIFTILLFSSVCAYSQLKSYTISGNVRNTDSANYAYLTTISQRIPVSSDKIFIKVPIVDGKFKFEVSFDLEGKKYQYACIILDKRGNITKEETTSRFRNLLWVTGRTRNIRRMILEDIELAAESYGEMYKSSVIKNGKLTVQHDEEDKAVRAGNRELLAFVKKYPDSDVAFEAVEEVTALTNESNMNRVASRSGTPKELFEALSYRLRTSKDGLILKKKIEQKLK